MAKKLQFGYIYDEPFLAFPVKKIISIQGANIYL